MISIQRIQNGTDLHRQELDLRQRVLLGPLGLTLADLEAAFPGCEERFEHFVAVLNHPSGPQVVACAVLLAPEADPEDGEARLGKVMQVATDPQMQSQGIGRRLMVAIEARALGELGLGGLYCHARGPAIPFYERLGWSVVGEPFEEVGIEHRRMELRGEPAGSSALDPEESL